MFRNTDPDSENAIPLLEPVVKTEVAEEQQPSSSSAPEPKQPKVNFVQIKNREVFDYEPNASSIHASMWPHWWLKAVHSRHKLRRAEAKKNVRFRTGLQHLLKEALEVRTIKLFSFKMVKSD